VIINIGGLEMILLLILLQQMNMTYVLVPTPEDFETEHGSVANLFRTLIAKKAYIALGDVTTNNLLFSLFDITNCHIITNVRWYTVFCQIFKMEQPLQNTVCGTMVSSDNIDCDCGHFD
jgi:hypothetical protein